MISPETSPPSAVEPTAGTEAPSPFLRLLRPRQWVKNGFVLAPLIFAGHFLDPRSVLAAVAAAVLFSIAASGVYVFNDLHDVERDRRHPTKRRSRPIAAGAISAGRAKAIIVGLWLLVTTAVVIRPELLLVIAGYIVLNVLYTRWLKHIPVVDLFSIALGFVLRVLAGAVAISVPLSSWMLITTLCLSLYLASIKRRQELGVSGVVGRSVLDGYSLRLLDRYAEMAAVGTIVFYGLFVIEVRPELVLTIPLVLFGLFRYWYIVETLGAGESPTDALWKDPPLALVVLAWGLVAMGALWPA